MSFGLRVNGALGGAAKGAAIGGAIPGLGTAIGGAIGGGLGLLSGLFGGESSIKDQMVLPKGVCLALYRTYILWISICNCYCFAIRKLHICSIDKINSSVYFCC